MQNQVVKNMEHEMETRLLLVLSALRMKFADSGAKFAVRALLSVVLGGPELIYVIQGWYIFGFRVQGLFAGDLRGGTEWREQ